MVNETVVDIFVIPNEKKNVLFYTLRSIMNICANYKYNNIDLKVFDFE